MNVSFQKYLKLLWAILNSKVIPYALKTAFKYLYIMSQ